MSNKDTRYRVRVKTVGGHIEAYPAPTRRRAEEKFRELLKDHTTNLAVQLEDSGKARGEFEVLWSCDLTREY